MQIINISESKFHESIVLKKIGDALYKIGDYVYVYDYISDKILANKWDEQKLINPTQCTDGVYYPLGGGRKIGESSLECIKREVFEETNGLMALDENSLFFIKKFFILSNLPFRYSEDCPYINGKELNVYLTLFSSNKLGSFTNIEVDNKIWVYDWYDSIEVFSRNINLGVEDWCKFCDLHNLAYFGISTEKINARRSLLVAYSAHKDQKDKGGNPYITHLVRVSKKVNSDCEKSVALLHDILEDTNINVDQLVKFGVDYKIIEKVDALTRKSFESYDDYLERIIKTNDVVVLKVKLADLQDNISRPEQITKQHLNKYLKAIAIVEEALIKLVK